jgi:uncharacterized protein YbjT (DUF2867 family)
VQQPSDRRSALVTGATGYIGGRLVSELLDAGFAVRVLARRPERLQHQPWFDQVDVCSGDASETETMLRALCGIDVAYYLLHSLIEGPGFEVTEAAMATTFADAARACGVERVVYLGGLQPTSSSSSPHMSSRAKVGEILRASGVPTAELRAAIILGSGSASFEMLRYLTERLPAMVTPRWVRNRVQPIAIRDVLHYLVASADLPDAVNRAFDIGGPDVLTYEQMMQRYAVIAGLPRRLIVGVPVLSPSLSSHWVGFVTPVPNAIARPLIESLRHEAICHEHDISRYIEPPDAGLTGFDRAVELALRRVKEANVVTRWSNASVAGAPSDALPSDPHWAGGSLYVDERERPCAASVESLWRVIEGVGGERGWYSFPLAWEVRGVMDRLAGGVGLRRGRRNPDRLFVGESLDFWRVEELVPEQLLRLRAEMRLPGLAWLELRITDDPVVYHQRAIFHPRGLWGHSYWWIVAPLHGIVFGSMARNIATEAERTEAERTEAERQASERADQPSSAAQVR